ncbi:HD domain-containing protein [Isoptericola hypogeus]|uniref:HD domain-containing protein n=1 Tax=Isoptericola hypogeus TaxID=300179 RepID=A0ABN2JSN3_9MICO
MALELPDSAPVRAALDVVTRFSPPALAHHAVRSTLLASDLGRRHGIDFDVDVLAVAGLLHDIGLVRAFDGHHEHFEVAGGNVAWVLAAGAGWPDGRRDRTARAVVDHMLDEDDVPVGERPEGHLLARATGVDVSGRGAELWPADVLAQVEQRWPRLDFADVFVPCLRDQAARKPDGVVAAFVAGGGADRVR